MPLRTGFVSFDRQPFSDSIDVGDELGFDFVEILMDGESRREVIEADQTAIADRLAEADLDALVHLPFPLLIGSPHDHQREGAKDELKECLRTAAAIGAEKAVLHPDAYGWVRVWDQEQIDPIIMDSIAELDKFAEDRGIEICVENLFEGYLTANDFDRLFEQTDASMTFDTGHAAIVGMNDEDMAEFVDEHRERVSHFHLNETRHLDVGYRNKDEHLPLGYGTIDFASILDPLLGTEWSGTLSIELDTPNFEYLSVSKDHLDRILDR